MCIRDSLKNDGLKHEIIKEALEITHEARIQILDEIMLPCISEPRKELAKTAPKMIKMTINPDKIREVIGLSLIHISPARRDFSRRCA